MLHFLVMCCCECFFLLLPQVFSSVFTGVPQTTPEWTPWSSWTVCSANPCQGLTGTQTRSRECHEQMDGYKIVLEPLHCESSASGTEPKEEQECGVAEGCEEGN